jgi:hypothetical protein
MKMNKLWRFATIQSLFKLKQDIFCYCLVNRECFVLTLSV